MAMSAKDREVAMELLKDEELVQQLEERIGMTNEGLRDAITYTLSGVQSPGFGVWGSDGGRRRWFDRLTRRAEAGTVGGSRGDDAGEFGAY